MILRLSKYVQCVILFLIVIPTLVQAQSEKATLRIIVISEAQGTTVPGANILLTVPEGDTLRSGITDANGFKEFFNLLPRTYQIQVSFVGYNTHRERITLDEGETRIYKTELSESTYALDELVVSGTELKPRVAGKQTISAVDISRVPNPGGGDLTAYLQTLPGVVTTGDRGGELFIRGGTPSQNLVLVDNMPIVRPFHISNQYSAFPQEVIGTVDLYAGGFGAKYKGATSSVLDISLRQGNMRAFNSKVAGSPHIVSFSTEGPLVKDKTSFLISGRHSTVEETAPSIIDQDVPLRFYDITARFSINWTGFTCSVTGLRTFDRGQINPQRNVRLGWTNTAIGSRCLGYSEELKSAVDVSAGFTDYSTSEGGLDDKFRTAGVRKWFVRIDNTTSLVNRPIDYGFGLDFTRYQANLEDPFNAKERFMKLDNFDELRGMFDAYGSINLQPLPNVTVVPGLASQLSVSSLTPTIEPRLRATWQPAGDETQEISLAAGRYVQFNEAIHDERDAGTVFYIYQHVDSEDPLPEALHGILGYSHQFDEKVQISAEGYVKLQKNIPVAQWSREPANTLETALADGQTYGADLRLEFNLLPFYMSLGYGWSEVIYEADSDDLAAWLDSEVFRYNPSHDRRHQLSVVSSYTFAGFTANASWQYSSGRPYTQLFAFDFALEDLPFQNPVEDRGRALALYSTPFDGRLPSIHRLDVSVERDFKLSRNFSLGAEVGAINAYDAQNIFYFDVNTLQQLDQTPLFPYVTLSAKIE